MSRGVVVAATAVVRGCRRVAAPVVSRLSLLSPVVGGLERPASRMRAASS